MHVRDCSQTREIENADSLSKRLDKAIALQELECLIRSLARRSRKHGQFALRYLNLAARARVQCRVEQVGESTSYALRSGPVTRPHRLTNEIR